MSTQPFTVVGIWIHNLQSFVYYVEATSIQEALDKAHAFIADDIYRSYRPSWLRKKPKSRPEAWDDAAYKTKPLAVFPGHHFECLEND